VRPIALPDENLAKEGFEQRICSLDRDAALGKNRPLQSISPLTRDARRHALQCGSSREKKMRKTQRIILTITGSVLIALSTIQFAAAASEHQGRTYHRAAATAQFRHSNALVEPAYVPQWSGYSYGGYSAPAGH
jgi:hypothetical protein